MLDMGVDGTGRRGGEEGKGKESLRSTQRLPCDQENVFKMWILEGLVL